MLKLLRMKTIKTIAYTIVFVNARDDRRSSNFLQKKAPKLGAFYIYLNISNPPTIFS